MHLPGNSPHPFIFAVAIGLLLSGCTSTRDERHLESLMRHRDWPRIEQIARMEVKKREKLSGWPDSAGYLPQDHTKSIWTVAATPGTRGGNERVVFLTISDEGNVLTYQRFVDGRPLP